MKKTTKLIAGLVLALILMISGVDSKGQEFKVNDNLFGFGVGLGHTYTYGYGSAWPAFFATYERGFKEIDDIGIISIGAITAIQHHSYSNVDLTWNNFYLMGRGVFHLTMLDIDKLDVYGGLSVGIRSSSVYDAFDDDLDASINPAWGLFVGGRYYLTENVAAFSELLYDVSYIKFGISFKF